MKVLLFTHEQDIDGMGSIILSKIAFSNLTYIPCKTFEIDKKVLSTINDKSIYDYDKIFITDLCINEPLLTMIDNDKKLKGKIIVLDHHQSEIQKGNNKYSFVHIIVENEIGKASGTSLFYDYLVKNKLLKETYVLKELTELTRQYDTWEWKKTNNLKARNLHLLFELNGYEEYIKKITNIVKTKKTLEFSKEDLKMINKFDKEMHNSIYNILKTMIVYNLNINNTTYRIGFVSSPYKYRNDFDEIIRQNNINNIDLIGIIMTDKETISYRNVKDVDVSIIGSYFGGKGHFGAASNPKDNPKFQKVLKKITTQIKK